MQSFNPFRISATRESRILKFYREAVNNVKDFAVHKNIISSTDCTIATNCLRTCIQITNEGTSFTGREGLINTFLLQSLFFFLTKWRDFLTDIMFSRRTPANFY